MKKLLLFFAFLVDVGFGFVCERGQAREDPKHFDGGPSFVHGGVTLWGVPRRITFEQQNGAESVQLTTKPGHVYMGSICGPRHWVAHSGGPPDAFFDSPQLGLLEVVLLLRSACFQQTRGSGRPNPPGTFEAALAGVLPCLAEQSWQLPSMDDCLESELELALEHSDSD